MFLKELQNLVSVLETYRGRDRIIRLATYGAMFMGGHGKTSTQNNWKTIASEMGACRMILRLFDDLSMLLLNLSTGFGLKGTKAPLKPLELITSVVNQIFYPIEHIAWLRQKKILNGFPGTFLLLGLCCWAVSLIAELLKSIIKLRINAAQTKTLILQEQLDKDRTGDSNQNAKIKENLKKLSSEKKDVILGMIQMACDLTNAISWFPPGMLTTRRLSPSTNGVLGTIASVIMLYRNWPTTTRT